MKILLLIRIGLVIGIGNVQSTAMASTECLPQTGGFHVFFTNGVLVTEDEAGRALAKLKEALGPTHTDQAINHYNLDLAHTDRTINYDIAYNYTKGPFEDLLQSADQYLAQYTSDFLLWLYGVGVVPDWFRALQEQLLQAQYQVSAPELSTHVEQYRQAITCQGERVLVIAHSQGNFYVNEATVLLADDEKDVPMSSFGIFAVATPANNVGGGSSFFLTNDYLTNHLDIMTLVPGALGPNWILERTSDHSMVEDISPIAAHRFLTTYLSKEFNTRAKLIREFKRTLDSLFAVLPSEIDPTCVTPATISAFTLHPPKYMSALIPFSATVEDPSCTIQDIYCAQPGKLSVIGYHCLILAPSGRPETTSMTVYGEFFYNIPRGSGTATLVVLHDSGAKAELAFSASWDCCADTSGVAHFSSKLSCIATGEFENHCGKWWQ